MPTAEIISLIVAIVSAVGISTAFTVLFHYYVRSTESNLGSGALDIELIDEAMRSRDEKYKRKKKIASVIKTVVFVLLLVLIVPLFLFSLIGRISGGKPVLGFSFMVVASDSMSKKNAENTYLFEGELDKQFNKFDIIVLNKVTSPDELELYDIVAYRNDKGSSVIHRIVGMATEEGAVKYSMRGDANNANDTYHPVFEDVIGVYKGSRARFIGAVVLFMQSYSGIVTVIALLYCMFTADYMSKKLDKATQSRQKLLLDAMFGEGTPQEIRYKGFVYRFDENGFTDKTETEIVSTDSDEMTVVVDSEPKKIKLVKRENDGKD